jgi:uncharacterized protein (DUF362 family)
MTGTPSFNRRTLLIGGSVAVAAASAGVARNMLAATAAVFVADHQRYDANLVRIIEDGLKSSGLDLPSLRGKRVLLKPNLVEPIRTAPHMTTHPTMVRSAAEVFRRFGAHVVVGEAPGHVRDTDMALEESGMAAMLRDAGLPFADLNYEDCVWTPNAGRASKLEGFHFPQSVASADLVVSMPKMKTHHWMGVTASLKNMYGVLPGIQYGWPKNVLHHAGIPETVFDINASLPKVISIVDGIECMEGDGPIMGSAKWMGLVIIGTNPTAVDATVCRLMAVDPHKVTYLRLAQDRLGPLTESRIEQRGCEWGPLAEPFMMLDKPHLNALRARGALVS